MGNPKRTGHLERDKAFAPPPYNDKYLNVDDGQLDFGTVWMTHRLPWALTLKNPTDQPIEVNQIWVSCGCVSAKPATLTVPARGTADLKLVMDLTDKSERDFLAKDKDFAVKITAQSGGERGASWVIRGHVKKALRSPQPSVDFAEQLVHGQPNPPRTVPLTSLQPLRQVNVSCDEATFLVQVRPAEPYDGKSFVLEVAPSGSIGAGPFQFDVRLELVPKGPGQPMSAVVPIRGTVLEDVQPLPIQISAGAMQVGESAEETVELRSVSGQPFEVKSVTASSPSVSVKPAAEATAAKRLYRVTYQATAVGEHRSEITFKLFNAKHGEMIVTVPVSYHGIATPR